MSRLRGLLMKFILILPVLSALVTPGAAADRVESPYRGEEARDIKALSPADVATLLAGDGMGFAKPAELNGYPGPAHVLELADELGLTDAQLDATRTIEREMRAAAKAAGRKLVAAERELDRQFASRTVTSASLNESLETIAALRAEVRRVHLEAHLRQTRLLNRDQVLRYPALRGYTDSGHHEKDRHH